MSEVTDIKRVCACGQVVIDPRGVGVRKTAEGVVGMSGLSTCGSVWVCPVCNAKIMSRRALEIGAAVSAWEARGARVGFITMTMRHDASQALGDLWDALAYAWAKVTTGKQWANDKARFGVSGWMKVVEVTLTWDNGWHVHVHALAFLEKGRDGKDLAGLHERMFGRWSRALQRRELEAPLMVGQDAHLVEGAGDKSIAEYLTKARDDGAYGIGLELVHSQSKTARTRFSSMTPWELLTILEEAEDQAEWLRAFDAWQEWVSGSRGRRQMGWSKGLRQELGLAAEKTDEEVAEEVVGEDTDTVVYVTAAGWRVMVAHPRWIGEMLDTLDVFGPKALREFLVRHDIEFEEV